MAGSFSNSEMKQIFSVQPNWVIDDVTINQNHLTIWQEVDENITHKILIQEQSQIVTLDSKNYRHLSENQPNTNFLMYREGLKKAQDQMALKTEFVKVGNDITERISFSQPEIEKVPEQFIPAEVAIDRQQVQAQKNKLSSIFKRLNYLPLAYLIITILIVITFVIEQIKIRLKTETSQRNQRAEIYTALGWVIAPIILLLIITWADLQNNLGLFGGVIVIAIMIIIAVFSLASLITAIIVFKKQKKSSLFLITLVNTAIVLTFIFIH